MSRKRKKVALKSPSGLSIMFEFRRLKPFVFFHEAWANLH